MFDSQFFPGTFVNRICEVYEPAVNNKSGVNQVLQTFETEDPYLNHSDEKLSFNCSTKVQLKLDKGRK